MLVTITVLALLAAACGQDGQGSETSTTTSSQETSTTSVASTTTTVTTSTEPPSTTTTTVASTTTTSATSTTTAPPGTSYAVGDDPQLTPPDPLPGSDGAAGSGCSPGAGQLPAGIWFGFLVVRNESNIEFDLACFYFGDIAWEKAAEAGEEANNDYWIVNQNPSLRTVPVAADADVWTIAGDATLGHQKLPYAQWTGAESTYTPCPGESCTVWLYVNDGAIDEILEQYLP